MRFPFAAAVAVAVLTASTSTLPASAAEPVRVLLDWFVNPDHAPLYVAKAKGYFDDAGLDVTLQPPADPNDPPKLVAAGKYDLAVSYQPQLHLQVAAGLPLVRVGTIVATPLNTIVVLEKGPIHEIADLEGKRIGYSVGGLEEALLGGVLGTAGLSMDDVTLVNVNWSLSPALIAGKVDAVIGAYRNFELNQMDMVGEPGRAFYLEEHGIPPYDELIVVANRDAVGEPKLRRFLDAVERGVQFLVNHPDESWDLFVGQNPDLDDDLNRRAWRDTLPRFALRPAALDTARYARFAEFLKAGGLIETAPPVADYAVELKQAAGR